jgi:hypothetical protein
MPLAGTGADINAVNFANSVFSTAQAIVAQMQAMETLKDRAAQDATLIPRAFSAISATRPDLAQADFTNFMSALTQLLFTYTSGSPSQQALIFKMIA